MVNSFSAGVSSFFPSGFLARLALLGKLGNIPRGETRFTPPLPEPLVMRGLDPRIHQKGICLQVMACRG
jgi:hypothetical protein